MLDLVSLGKLVPSRWWATKCWAPITIRSIIKTAGTVIVKSLEGSLVSSRYRFTENAWKSM